MSAALAALNQRVPLGSCDLEKALAAAAGSYSGDSTTARAVIYVGDGSSRANSFGTEQFEQMVAGLVAERLPVIEYGVGPRLDKQVLGALAGRTGGVLIDESAAGSAEQVGRQLAAAVHGSVYWPGAAVKWPAGMDVYPKNMPPLRSDRDTVLVGTMKGAGPQQVELAVEGPAGARKLAFDLPAGKPADANNYLVSVVDQARVDGGLSLPIVDTASLRAAKEEIDAGGRSLKWLAGHALTAGNLEGAERLADEALRRDPGDAAAQAIKAAVAKHAAGAGPVAPAALPPPPAAAAAAPAAGDANDLNLVGALQGRPAGRRGHGQGIRQQAEPGQGVHAKGGAKRHQLRPRRDGNQPRARPAGAAIGSAKGARDRRAAARDPRPVDRHVDGHHSRGPYPAGRGREPAAADPGISRRRERARADSGGVHPQPGQAEAVDGPLRVFDAGGEAQGSGGAGDAGGAEPGPQRPAHGDARGGRRHPLLADEGRAGRPIGGPRGKRADVRRHAIPGRQIGHSLPGRAAHRLSRRRRVAGSDQAPQGKISALPISRSRVRRRSGSKTP